MAVFAEYVDVRTGQGEITLIVIKRNSIPGLRRMTGSAVRAKAAIMLVVLSVAGKAINRCALEYVVLMTFRAVQVGVFPIERESGQVMVKRRTLPSIRRMADFTGCAKAQLVWVVRTVAGVTFLWRCFKIGPAARINMTQHAFHFLVTASQPEL